MGTWFDKIFPAFLTGWKTWFALVLWMAWVMFVSPVMGLEAADEIVQFALVAFGGASVASKLARWEAIIAGK